MMPKTLQNSIKKAVSIITSVWAGLVGILFIVQVWRIFAMGSYAFTVKNISEKFSQIAVFAYIGLALLLVSCILSLAMPNEKEKTMPFALSNSVTLKRLQRRVPKQTETDLETWQSVYTWKVRNVISWCVCLVLGTLCFCVSIAYLVGGFAPVSQKGFFAEHPTAEFILRAMPWVFGTLGTGVFAVYFHAYTQSKRITLLKTLLADAVKRGEKPVAVTPQKRNEFAFTQSAWFLPVVRGVVGAIAITFMIMGICTGGMGDVFSNAITICTQCIGLG